MKIPSYDDLTPSITDVHPRDTFEFAARLVPCSHEPVVQAASETSIVGTGRPASSPLFACVRALAPAPGALLALARDFSPRIERYGDGCIVLDVSGLGRLLGDAHGIAVELERAARERGIRMRSAVAPTQVAARLLAFDPEAPRVSAAAAAPVLASVALRAFEAWYASEAPVSGRSDRERRGSSELKLFETLRRWGLRTIGEFAALPAGELAARFGQPGLALQRLACGIDPRPLVPDPGVPRFVQAIELEWPIEELEPLSFVLARLLDPLSTALERADRAAAAIRLDLRLVDRSVHARVLQLPAAMRDARVLRTLLMLDLESHPPSAGIDVVTVEVDPAPSRIVQFSLLERAIPSPETLATLTARLGALVGEDRCGSAAMLDAHRPDAFEMRRFDPGDRPHAKRAETGIEAARAADDRPLILRRYRPVVAIRVALERGRPAHVPVDRKGMPGGRVIRAAGPWRTSGEWWDAGGGYWSHDEWDVELSDGAVCRLYRDRETDRWFLEGAYD